MTVKELKETLNQFDENLNVEIYEKHTNWGLHEEITRYDIVDIEIDKKEKIVFLKV